MASSSSRSSTPPALIVSIVFGSVGMVLLIIGLVGDSQTLLVCGVGGGAISLIAALVWREQLIDAWHARKPQPGD